VPGIGEKPYRVPVSKRRHELPKKRAARDLGKDLLNAPRRTSSGDYRTTSPIPKVSSILKPLAATIPNLEGDTKREARQALTMRLTRMKDTTLADYFTDEDPEIRRAAALASGTKGILSHVESAY
jgi:hypothetical protein